MLPKESANMRDISYEDWLDGDNKDTSKWSQDRENTQRDIDLIDQKPLRYPLKPRASSTGDMGKNR